MPPRTKSPRNQYVFALDTVSVREPGSKYPTTVQKGTVWHADSPMVRSHPGLFGDDPAVVYPLNWSPPVEQATAAPGEVRDSTRG